MIRHSASLEESPYPVPAVDQQGREDQRATRQLQQRHALVEPPGGHQRGPDRLEHQDDRGMAGGGQALGVDLEEEAQGAGEEDAGGDPAEGGGREA